MFIRINPAALSFSVITAQKKMQKEARIINKTLEAIERDYILQTLAQTGWKVGGKNSAAEILGLDRSTLRARMRKLNIQKP